MNASRAIAWLWCALITSVSAANWPAFRGPDGSGVADEKNLPLRWSTNENVAWRVPLPDRGNSTPIVWGERVFITQATEGGARRRLTKREIVIEQLVDKCAGADLRATKILLDMLHKLERGVAPTAVETVSSDAADGVYELLHAKLARLALAQGAALPAADPSERGDGAQPRAKDDDR